MVAVEFPQLKNPHIITSSLTISSVLLAVSVLTVKIKLRFRSGSFVSMAIFALLGLAWTVAVSLTVSVLLTVSASPMVVASLTTLLRRPFLLNQQLLWCRDCWRRASHDEGHGCFHFSD